MRLSRLYVIELHHRIFYDWNSKEEHRGTRGSRSGVYFVVGEFIIDGEIKILVKIGKTTNAIRRRQCLKTDNPSDTFYVYFHKTFCSLVEVEREYHRRFKDFKVRGEWYDFLSVVKEMGWDTNQFFKE